MYSKHLLCLCTLHAYTAEICTSYAYASLLDVEADDAVVADAQVGSVRLV